MAEIAVVGAGLAGAAVAARLAKQGHRVTIVERRPSGLLPVGAQSFRTSLPGVLRDLFRKSGRPLERYADLQLAIPARRHVLPDGAGLDLPGGTRGGQYDAVAAALGAEAAGAWTRFVDDRAATWDLLRRGLLDPPTGTQRLADRRTATAVDARRGLDALLLAELPDPRLHELVRDPVRRAGGDPGGEPGFRAVEVYLERTFGTWWFAAGSSDLATALTTRLSERGVAVRYGEEVAILSTKAGRVTGLELVDGSRIEPELVVTAVAPEQVFGRLLQSRSTRKAARLFERSPTGWLPWRGPRTAAARAELSNPLPNLYCLGTRLQLADPAFPAWEAATVAQAVPSPPRGRAARPAVEGGTADPAQP